MDIPAVVRSRILQLTGVTTLVSTRVYTGPSWPQKVTVPAVRVHRIDDQELSHLKGPDGLIRERIQVDSLATTRAGAVALDAAIDGDGAGSGLNHWAGSVGSVRVVLIAPEDVHEGFDGDELQYYKIMRDYFVRVKR